MKSYYTLFSSILNYFWPTLFKFIFFLSLSFCPISFSLFHFFFPSLLCALPLFSIALITFSVLHSSPLSSVDFGNGLGFAGWKRAWWRGGWKRAWVCRSQPGLADLGLVVCRSQPGFSDLGLGLLFVAWWSGGCYWVLVVAAWWSGGCYRSGDNKEEKGNEEREKKKVKIK